MDIFIAKVKYPNDTKNNHVPHQNFIGYIDDDKIIFYSISSLTNNKMALKNILIITIPSFPTNRLKIISKHHHL